MMVDEREIINGHGCDLNCSLEPPTEATDNDKGGLLLDGSSGGVSCGEVTSAERLIIYARRKRRKMSKSDEKTTDFYDKIKRADGSASDQDVPRLSFGQGECSLRHCKKVVLDPESGCKSAAIKEPADNSKRVDNQTHKQLQLVIPNNQSDLCGRAFSDILTSEKFSKLCGLLVNNCGVTNINQILDFDTVNTRMKNGVYQTSPLLYHRDIQQVWAKLQQVGNEIVTLAKSLSDKSRAHYEQQFVRKPKATTSNCQGCGESAHPQNCLVCDSCEEIYHVSCTDLMGPEMPPKTWYCPRCVSDGIGSPHDNCMVCEKLKSTPSIPPVNGLLTPDGSGSGSGSGSDSDVPEQTSQGSKTCFICKSEVKTGDNFRTCGHSLCAHKFYHYNCLTSKQLGVCGPCWYCPSCLCRRCLVDKDDDQIVLCDGCDQAYHMYCTTPQLSSIPEGRWFCGKCDRELNRIRTMKKLYENMQKKVKVEEGSETAGNNSGGLEMLVTAAKTLSHQETMEMEKY
ncbi:hypothetical protein L2E82_17838 [Cichorium intybus]|uniref:Uncharacterized protein n=1 Tax=Cichorium intybus TaxID=13427 RepID=A0ACB9F9M3_CICIN|nr:hypothetical protein L2E82_17838 [Cichorium intybus]